MEQKVFILLGRTGDQLIILPCLQAIARQSTSKPRVIVCQEFAGVYRGVSYAEAEQVRGHWYASLSTISQMAKLKYGEGNFTIVQCHGHGWDTDQTKYPTFGHAMRARMGFPTYDSLPLVFDRRNPGREQKLLDRVLYGTTSKSTLLYNFRGLSSPLAAGQAIRHRMRRFEDKFHLVNLGQLQAERIYDLLALYDRAAGLITIDTSTLHLAAASPVPMLAYVRGGWSSAIPKAGAMSVKYADAEKDLDKVDEFLEAIRK